MKVSLSLSDDVGAQMRNIARHHGVSDSSIAEIALKAFVWEPEDAVKAAIIENNASRRRLSRMGWMEAFWNALAKAMGTVDFDGGGVRVLAPRHYGRFDAVFLLNHVDGQDGEDEPIHFRLMGIVQPGASGASPIAGSAFVFDRQQSVYGSAQLVADYILTT